MYDNLTRERLETITQRPIGNNIHHRSTPSRVCRHIGVDCELWKIHYYLGVVFDYRTDGEILIHMYQYIEELTNGAPGRYKVGLRSATPAASHLFDVRNSEHEKVKNSHEK